MPKTLTFNEIDTKAVQLIRNRESFEVKALGGKVLDAVKKIEYLIENEGLTCRIYTKGRLASAGATVAGGITGMLGAASAIGIAAHNIATYNPDYEVSKNLIDNKLTITYKK